MTDDGHMVFVSAEQAEVIEEVGIELSRQRDERSIKLLALALAYKWAKPVDEGEYHNVVDIVERLNPYSKRA